MFFPMLPAVPEAWICWDSDFCVAHFIQLHSFCNYPVWIFDACNNLTAFFLWSLIPQSCQKRNDVDFLKAYQYPIKPPRKPTCHMKINGWKTYFIIFLLKWSLLRGHSFIFGGVVVYWYLHPSEQAPHHFHQVRNGRSDQSPKGNLLRCHPRRGLEFPQIGVGPQNGWFIMEHLIKMDDLGGPPLFLETPIWPIWMLYDSSWYFFTTCLD